MRLTNTYEVILLFLTLLTLLVQIYALYLMWFKSPKNMSEYGKLLAYITIWDVVFNILLGLVMAPGLFFPVPGMYFTGLGEEISRLLGQETTRVLTAMFLYCVVSLVENQNWCLMYRFTVINHNQKLHQYFMSVPGIIVTISFGVTICFSITIPAYVAVIVTGERMYEVLKSYPEESYSYLLPDAQMVVFDISNPLVPYLVSFVGIMFVFSQFISLACCWYIIATLKKNSSSFTARTYQMHLQLTRILIFQFFIPFIFIVFPMLDYIIQSLLKADLPTWWGQVVMLFIAIFPFTSAMVNIVFITPYWKFTEQWIVKLLRKLKLIKKVEQEVIQALPQASSSISFTLNK